MRIRHPEKKLSLCLLAAAVAILAPPAMALDVDAAYKTTWVDPFQRSVLTTERNTLKAELTRRQPIFSGCPEECTGGLKIFLNGKFIYQDSYAAVQRQISGPWFSKDGDPPTVFVELMAPDSPGDYGEPEAVIAYKVDPHTGAVSRSISKTIAIDDEQANERTVEVQDSQYGDTEATLSCDKVSADNPSNWQLVIKKAGKTVFSGNPASPDVCSNADKWNPPHVYGPFVTSLDGGKDAQVVLAFETVMDSGSSCNTFYWQKIYHFDQTSQDMKCLTTSFGESNPRFASVGNPAALRLASEDWSLPHDIWKGNAGPLQIWKWDNDKLTNITNEYPEEIQKHAQGSLSRFLSEKSNNEFADDWLIGHIGDLCLLNEKTKAISELETYQTKKTQANHDQILEQLKKHGYL